MNNSGFEVVLHTLKTANATKPWMTASRIDQLHGMRTGASTRVLMEHLKECLHAEVAPLVRYSNLPSKESLEVLWGAVEQPKVGDRPVKPIRRVDVPTDVLGCANQQPANIFFSHSHKDFKPVVQIAETLITNNFSPWLAETHIAQGASINERIIEAMNTTDVFLLFLSRNSLNSRWAGKEYAKAVRLKIPICVVVDCDQVTADGIVRRATTAELKELISKFEQRFGVHGYHPNTNQCVVEYFACLPSSDFDDANLGSTLIAGGENEMLRALQEHLANS